MTTRTTSADLLDHRLKATPDGLACRSIGTWTLQKLAFESLYFEGFTNACKRASEMYYVDGLAGPGIGTVRGSAPVYTAWGSPLLALQTRPAFTRCILMEQGPASYGALRQRVAAFGDQAVALRGDVNRDLVPAVQQHVPSWAPCFCLLDPEATELRWSTVEGLARLPGRRRKPELLILFPTHLGWVRVLRRDGKLHPTTIDRLNRWLGTDEWWPIYQDRRDHVISAGEALNRYLALYQTQVERLGYTHVRQRPITTRSTAWAPREVQYHLVFATDHDAGEAIMHHVFRREFVLETPRTLMRLLPNFDL